MNRNIVIIFIFLFFAFNLQFSQVSPAYTPMSLENVGGELSINSIIINAEDLEIDFRDNARLTIYPDQYIWRLELILPAFRSGHIAITNWLIPEGGRLFIFNDLVSYTGPYLHRSDKAFITGRFTSKKITLEYSEPVNAKFSGNFKIDRILPDFIIPSSQGVDIETLKVNLTRERPKIMVTGYWPPTNEMVRHFSQNIELNPEGWQGENWEGLGYDVISFFPEFDPADCNNCGQGFGNLEVDYQDFSGDFWPIIEEVHPVAIITFSKLKVHVVKNFIMVHC